MKFIAMVAVCSIILAGCGQNPKEQATKPINQVESVRDRSKPENAYFDSFEIFTESRIIDITKPVLENIELQFKLPTRIKSVDLKIIYKSSTLWSKTVILPQPAKATIFLADVTNIKTPDDIKLPACYTILGTSNLGTKASRTIQLIDKNIFQQTISKGSIDDQEVGKFIQEYENINKIKQYFADDMKLTILNTINRLQTFIFDKDLSEVYGKVVFTNTFNCDFEGFTFINKSSLNYDYGK